MGKRKAVIEFPISPSDHDVQPKKRQQATTPIIEIDPSGNLVVAIGVVCQLVKVNSTLLCAVSPVFKTMLGPSFKEGQSVSDLGNPLKLPEDDSIATINMFHLAHFNASSINSSCKDWVQKLLVVCDKYKCTLRFKDFFVLQLIRSQQNVTTSYSDADAFVMAYLMDDQKSFDELSESIVRMSRENFQVLCHKDFLDLFPAGVLEKMQSFRRGVRNEYARHSHSFALYLDTFIPSDQWCQKAQQVIGAFSKLLLQQGVIRHDYEPDVDLMDMHMVLQCKTFGCDSCGRRLDIALMSIREAVKIGRKDGCRICFQCFKGGIFELTVTCKHHTSA